MNRLKLMAKRKNRANSELISDHQYELHKRSIRSRLKKLEEILPTNMKQIKLKFTESLFSRRLSQPLGRWDKANNMILINSNVRQISFMTNILAHEYDKCNER